MQVKNNDLDYLIDPAFRNIHRLFVLLIENNNEDPARDSFDEYCMPSVEIKYLMHSLTINHFLSASKK